MPNNLTQYLVLRQHACDKRNLPSMEGEKPTVVPVLSPRRERRLLKKRASFALANLLISDAAEPVLEALPPPPKPGRGHRRSWAPDGAEAKWYAAFAVLYPKRAKRYGAFAIKSYLRAIKSYNGKFNGGNEARHKRWLRARKGSGDYLVKFK